MAAVIPTCPTCKGEMKKTSMGTSGCLTVIAAFAMFVIGLVAMIFIPVLGWIGGPILMILALFLGGKRQKIWRCRSCRSYVQRA